MNGPERLKRTLAGFWAMFGGRKLRGIGFEAEAKLESLRMLSEVRIPYIRQQPLETRRENFNVAKPKLHSFRRFGFCFVCGKKASVRHHIIQLQHGGINSKKNIVSLCKQCHSKIHPWL